MSSILSKDQIKILLPALKHLAELIQKYGAIHREELELLMLAGGLDKDWTLNELGKWAKMLMAVRGITDKTRQETTVSALKIRGIPEEFARLAVKSAVNVSVLKPEIHILPIQVKSDLISFGTLKAGEGGKKDLIVSGGPGQIKNRSDMLVVNPETFGPGETLLTITLRGGKEEQELSEEIILINPDNPFDTVTVSITARWDKKTEEIKKFVVPRDGSLEELLIKINDGEKIHIESGEFHLPKPVSITKSVYLQGAGINLTSIICEGEEYVLQFDGKGLFTASGLTFEHKGGKKADVLRVMGGKINLQFCRFSGGMSDEINKQIGNGLFLCGNTIGTVSMCELRNNNKSGIYSGGQVNLNLEKNTCHWNREDGIAYYDSAGGNACKNNCNRNEEYGIKVGNQAHPNLNENICQGNKWSGIS